MIRAAWRTLAPQPCIRRRDRHSDLHAAGTLHPTGSGPPCPAPGEPGTLGFTSLHARKASRFYAAALLRAAPAPGTPFRGFVATLLSPSASMPGLGPGHPCPDTPRDWCGPSPPAGGGGVAVWPGRPATFAGSSRPARTPRPASRHFVPRRAATLSLSAGRPAISPSPSARGSGWPARGPARSSLRSSPGFRPTGRGRPQARWRPAVASPAGATVAALPSPTAIRPRWLAILRRARCGPARRPRPGSRLTAARRLHRPAPPRPGSSPP